MKNSKGTVRDESHFYYGEGGLIKCKEFGDYIVIAANKVMVENIVNAIGHESIEPENIKRVALFAKGRVTSKDNS